MPAGARRPLSRLWLRRTRRAGLALSLWLPLLAAPAPAVASETITTARYAEPTTRYDHAVLGDDVEWGALILTLAPCDGCAGLKVALRLPPERVFEDLAPRLITGDHGRPLAMVVESDTAKGARLALYDGTGLYAATPFIGQRHRWLAPLGAADLDGDGHLEIAYIDRPHLAKTLRVWRLRAGKLTQVATAEGLTNHRIGWDFIPGGLRTCGPRPEMITANADWTRIMATTLEGGRLRSRDLGPYADPESLDAALTCP